MPLSNGALSSGFAQIKVQIDYSVELAKESKAKIIKELKTIPLIINEHNFLEGGAHLLSCRQEPWISTSLSIDALYAFKDDPETLSFTFFERLRLHLESVPRTKLLASRL